QEASPITLAGCDRANKVPGVSGLLMLSTRSTQSSGTDTESPGTALSTVTTQYKHKDHYRSLWEQYKVLLIFPPNSTFSVSSID
ncbi:mCG146066, partial [Mus musculus]